MIHMSDESKESLFDYFTYHLLSNKGHVHLCGNDSHFNFITYGLMWQATKHQPTGMSGVAHLFESEGSVPCVIPCEL